MAQENTAKVIETPEQHLARVIAENAALQAQVAKLNQPKNNLRLKISETTRALSVYGLGRFPVTLYKEQWMRIMSDSFVKEVKEFIVAHDKELKSKGE